MDDALRTAARTGDAVAVRQGLDAGAPIDGRDRYGQTMLMLAAHAGHEAIVSDLVARGADLDVTAKYGLSALMLAIVAGRQDVARILVAAGADTTLRGTGAAGFAGKTAADLARLRGLADLPPDG
jgi:hypothetical protein